MFDGARRTTTNSPVQPRRTTTNSPVQPVRPVGRGQGTGKGLSSPQDNGAAGPSVRHHGTHKPRHPADVSAVVYGLPRAAKRSHGPGVIHVLQ